MYINTDSKTFVPEDFIILNFYGKNTCFIWNEDELICFPYVTKDSITLKILKAPSKVKRIRGFKERIFVLCYPTGIYKLTDNLEFASLSKAGIELGSDFCEVLTPNNGILVMEDKKTKNFKKLFHISTTNNIYVVSLNYENTNKDFYKALLPDSYNSNKNLCIISHEKKLYKMLDQAVQIIYNSDFLIKKIVSIEKHDMITALVLQTNINFVIIMHVVDSKLRYTKISFESNVQRICAVPNLSNDNILFFIYSDEHKVHYIRKNLIEDSMQEIKIEEKSYATFKPYQSKSIIYLNNDMELFQVNIEHLKNNDENRSSDFVKLEQTMLRSLDNVIESICNKTLELKIRKEQLLKSEDKLKRINMFVNKQNIKFCSEDSVKRFLNQAFIVSDYKRILPENSVVVKMLSSRGKVIFTMRGVNDQNTVVNMPICLPNLSSRLYISTDLISHKSDEQIWCLIKNYVCDPPPNQDDYLLPNKVEFIKYKLIVLQNLVKENQLNMEELAKIKSDVRKRLDE